MLSMTSIVRAWKDDEYRQSLSEAERAALPQNPAGMVELTDGELAEVAGLLRLIGRFDLLLTGKVVEQ